MQSSKTSHKQAGEDRNQRARAADQPTKTQRQKMLDREEHSRVLAKKEVQLKPELRVENFHQNDDIRRINSAALRKQDKKANEALIEMKKRKKEKAASEKHEYEELLQSRHEEARKRHQEEVHQRKLLDSNPLDVQCKPEIGADTENLYINDNIRKFNSAVLRKQDEKVNDVLIEMKKRKKEKAASEKREYEELLQSRHEEALRRDQEEVHQRKLLARSSLDVQCKPEIRADTENLYVNDNIRKFNSAVLRKQDEKVNEALIEMKRKKEIAASEKSEIEMQKLQARSLAKFHTSQMKTEEMARQKERMQEEKHREVLQCLEKQRAREQRHMAEMIAKSKRSDSTCALEDIPRSKSNRERQMDQKRLPTEVQKPKPAQLEMEQKVVQRKPVPSENLGLEISKKIVWDKLAASKEEQAASALREEQRIAKNVARREAEVAKQRQLDAENRAAMVQSLQADWEKMKQEKEQQKKAARQRGVDQLKALKDLDRWTLAQHNGAQKNRGERIGIDKFNAFLVSGKKAFLQEEHNAAAKEKSLVPTVSKERASNLSANTREPLLKLRRAKQENPNQLPDLKCNKVTINLRQTCLSSKPAVSMIQQTSVKRSTTCLPPIENATSLYS